MGKTFREVTKLEAWQLLSQLEEHGLLRTIPQENTIYYMLKADGEWNGANHIVYVECGVEPKFYKVS